jgi:hypothetical protein
MASPPIISNSIGSNLPTGVFRRPNDPSKLLIDRRRFERPRLSIIGGDEFEWPLGVEGIEISGSASLAEHLYIGDNAAVLQVMHSDNRRIVLTGMFPGLTGSANVRDLLEILIAPTDDNGKILTLPNSIFPRTQIVVPETWSFSHPEEDSSDSWTYTTTLRRTGVGAKVKAPRTTVSPLDPIPSTAKPRGNSARFVTVNSSVTTLRGVAANLFENPNRWRELYDKNRKILDALGVPLALLAVKRLPIGMKLFY